MIATSYKFIYIFQVKKDAFPSHARHMVQVAQEKADLTEQSELLAKQIEKEEEELASLEQVNRVILNNEFPINPMRILLKNFKQFLCHRLFPAGIHHISSSKKYERTIS